MPIEIKELNIKITVEENINNKIPEVSTTQILNDSNLKNRIVEECTEKVLKKIKQKTER